MPVTKNRRVPSTDPSQKKRKKKLRPLSSAAVTSSSTPFRFIHKLKIDGSSTSQKKNRFIEMAYLLVFLLPARSVTLSTQAFCIFCPFSCRTKKNCERKPQKQNFGISLLRFRFIANSHLDFGFVSFFFVSSPWQGECERDRKGSKYFSHVSLSQYLEFRIIFFSVF